MYVALLIMVILFAVIGFSYRSLDLALFRIEMVILTLVCCFRYGQGADYHAYELHYYSNLDFREKLFSLINNIVIQRGLSYQMFLSVICVLSMALTWRGIYRLSPIRTISSLLLFPTFYMTYFFSGIREGLVLSIAIGIVLPFVLEHRTISAFIAICIATSIHQSGIIMFLMLPNIPWYKMRRIMIFLSSVCGMSLWFFLQYFSINIHELKFDPSYPALILRLTVFCMITLLFERSEKTEEINRLYSLYFLGFCIFLVFFCSALFSNRGTAYFKIIELILIPNMLGKMNTVSMADCRYSMRKMLFTGIVVICLVEGIKNFASYPRLLNYPDNITFYNYPYISIFNSEKEKMYYGWY